MRSFTYDGAGNITADATGSVTYGLAYNKANRLGITVTVHFIDIARARV